MWEENDYDVMEDIKFYLKDHNIDLDKKDQSPHLMNALLDKALSYENVKALEYIIDIGFDFKKSTMELTRLFDSLAEKEYFTAFVEQFKRLGVFDNLKNELPKEYCILSTLFERNEPEKIKILLESGYPKIFSGYYNHIHSLINKNKYEEVKNLIIEEGYSFNLLTFDKIINYKQDGNIVHVVDLLIDNAKNNTLDEIKEIKSKLLVDLFAQYHVELDDLKKLINKEPYVDLDIVYLMTNTMIISGDSFYNVLEKNDYEKLLFLNETPIFNKEENKRKIESIIFKSIEKLLLRDQVDEFKEILNKTNQTLDKFLEHRRYIIQELFKLSREDSIQFIKDVAPESLENNNLILASVEYSLETWEESQFNKRLLNFIGNFGLNEETINKKFDIKISKETPYKETTTLFDLAIQYRNDELFQKVANFPGFDLNVHMETLFYSTLRNNSVYSDLLYITKQPGFEIFPNEEILALREKAENKIVKAEEVHNVLLSFFAEKEKEILLENLKENGIINRPSTRRL